MIRTNVNRCAKGVLTLVPFRGLRLSMDKREIEELLRCRGTDQRNLFEQARYTRRNVFGDKAIVRGVIEVTSVCIQNCTYCPMRRDNRIERFTLKPQQIIDATRSIYDLGIEIVSLQGGETPKSADLVAQVIPKVRAIYDDRVDILLVLGDLAKNKYAELRSLGATSYILKHETASPSLHLMHRFYELGERLGHLNTLLELGYRVGTGTIVGLPGQTIEILADDILLAVELGVHMSSASPFIPARDTPLADNALGDLDLTLNTIAIMRVLRPDAMIPSVSALEKVQVGGQSLGFHAGANVMTINFTPQTNQANYPIYGSDRFIVKGTHAASVLSKAGLHADFMNHLVKKHASV